MKKYAYTLFIFFTVFSSLLTGSAAEKKYKYRIEYYYDDVLEEKSTTYKEGTFASLIVDYETKNRDGYLFSHSSVDDAGMTITEDENANVIKVFYEKKEDSAKVSSEKDTKESLDELSEFKQKLQSIFRFFKDLFSSY